MTFFELHLELASKGMAEGAVSIAGLPDAALNRDSAHRTAFSAAVEGWANREVVVAVLAGGSATLQFGRQFTGTAVTQADLTDAARITIAGQYMTSMPGGP